VTLVRAATLDDIPYIDHLRKQESGAVGFIPLERYEMEVDGRRGGTILVAEENGQHVGFLYATHNRTGVTHIQQVAIQEDARRLERATLLVETVQKERDWLVSLRVAADLEATHFWEALGFELESHVDPKSVYGRGKDKATKPTRHKRDILRFQKVVGGLWLPTEPLP
jgi:N-acetylglutamate synthase-like GNAT family acetyltransferase